MTTVIERSVAPGIHRVDHAYVNWYVIEDGDELTIVDAGLPRAWGALDRLLRLLGRPLSAVSAVVLTHAHFDHVGFARRMRERGVPVLVHEGDANLLEHPFRYDHEAPRSRYLSVGLARIMATMAAAGAPSIRGLKPSHTFADGDILDVPGRPRVVFTPGHTYGHSSLHLPEAGAVVTGDALVTFDIYTQQAGPRIVAAAATASIEQALRSLDRLAEIDAGAANVLLPGHGDPWTGHVDEAIRRAHEAGPA
jgi:glyoxylase-like metal-dependent hydrolase (beta-lactamase superfamily II)